MLSDHGRFDDEINLNNNKRLLLKLDHFCRCEEATQLLEISFKVVCQILAFLDLLKLKFDYPFLDCRLGGEGRMFVRFP
jgi:hypothetical protein